MTRLGIGPGQHRPSALSPVISSDSVRWGAQAGRARLLSFSAGWPRIAPARRADSVPELVARPARPQVQVPTRRTRR